MAHMRRDFNPRERSRGLMLIEAALVFFVFLLLTFGIIEYSWMFMPEHLDSLEEVICPW